MGERLQRSLASYEAARFSARVQTSIVDAQKPVVYKTELSGSTDAWKQTRSYAPDSYINSGLPKLSSLVKK